MLKTIVAASIGLAAGLAINKQPPTFVASVCPDERDKTVYVSYHKKDEMTCVYIEPFKTRGKKLTRKTI